MWLQALLTQADIQHVFSELTPVKVSLDATDPERYLWLAQPTSVEIVDNQSLRLVTSGKLQWDLVGLTLPVALRTISLRATPAIERQDGHDVITFGVQIEDADLSAVPGFLETPLIARINETLQARHTQIVWRFGETLDFHFQMPALSEPRRSVHLFARDGAVRFSDEGLVIAASFELAAHTQGSAPEEPRPADVQESAASAA